MATGPNHTAPLRPSSNVRKVESAQRMAFGKPFPCRTCTIRPWRGPLPRPRPAAQLTLAAFLPPSTWAHDSVSSIDNEVIMGERDSGVAFSTAARAPSLGNGQPVFFARETQENSSNPATVVLIKKAKAFGRSRLYLIRHNQGKGRGALSKLKEVDATGVQYSACSPSYAEMTARPPPPNQRASDATRPPAPNNRYPRQDDGGAGVHGRVKDMVLVRRHIAKARGAEDSMVETTIGTLAMARQGVGGASHHSLATSSGWGAKPPTWSRRLR